MSAALGLLRLQQVDSRLSQVESRIETIRKVLENDAELVAAREKLAQAEAERNQSDRTRRDLEAEARAQQNKIEQAESSLYGGSVRNPKELQELQEDVASLKRRLTALEDQELESMARVESAQTVLLAAGEYLSQLESRANSEHGTLMAESSVLARDRQALLAERQAAVSTVAAEMLDAYDSLRRARRGIAVSEVSENACAACGTVLTAALQQNARHASQLVYCPSCGRILYAG
jgi:hypothetical protein